MSARPRKRPIEPSPAGGRAHREQAASSSPAIRFRIDFYDCCSVGLSKILLLEAIERTGSLTQAAREIPMSYRPAWLLMDSMQTEFDTPVINATVGGISGGGAKLTDFGRELINAYRELESRLTGLAAEHMGKIAAHALNRRSRLRVNGVLPRERVSQRPKRDI